MILTSTSPGPGVGPGTSSTASGSPNARTTAAFVAIAIPTPSRRRWQWTYRVETRLLARKNCLSRGLFARILRKIPRGCELITRARDQIDGPVVKAAQRALETQNPAPVLMWVQLDDESEILRAFEETLAVRVL